MREIISVSSMYDAKSRITTVQVDVGKRTCMGTFVHSATGVGRAKWNKYDKFDPNEGFRVAYERALAQIPEENIIEKCGGLKDGDWVHIHSKHTNCEAWGIVSHDNILYVMGSGNYDRISDFPNGETQFDKIITVVRPAGSSHPVTYDTIHKKVYERDYMKKYCEIYTAD